MAKGFEHDLILERLENPACVLSNFAIRRYYENTVYANSQQQSNILMLSQPLADTGICYKAANSLTSTPE